MSHDAEDRRAVSRPCEDCGGQVVTGLEPFEYGSAGEAVHERSEWCTNSACPSNHVLDGLHRTGINDYLCLECGEALRTPMPQVMRHRGLHRAQPDGPGSSTHA